MNLHPVFFPVFQIYISISLLFITEYMIGLSNYHFQNRIKKFFALFFHAPHFHQDNFVSLNDSFIYLRTHSERLQAEIPGVNLDLFLTFISYLQSFTTMFHSSSEIHFLYLVKQQQLQKLVKGGQTDFIQTDIVRDRDSSIN